MRRPILHVIPFLWSGAGGVVTRLCEAQRRHGPVVIVTTSKAADQSDWPTYRRRLQRAGVTHHTINFFHRGDGQFWSSVTPLAELVRTLKPAVIHAHAGVPCCGAIVARAISGHRCRVIGQMYSWGPNRPEWMNQQDMWGFSQADRVVCSAYAYRDLLVRYGVPSRKLVYLPWGLPLEKLAWRGDHAPVNTGVGPVFGFVGRIEPRKGQLDLVEAFARLHAKQPAARLELVGPIADAAYAAKIGEAIASHGLEDAVLLTGEVRDVTSYVRRWDVFVSLSADEGQGLAALEAMAIGVPVAARRVAGIVDFLVDGRTGFVVDGSSPRAIAATMRRAAEESTTARAIARRARRLVERRYAWDQTVAAFDRLYRGERRGG
jgi:glycogen(starch) synthase